MRALLSHMINEPSNEDRVASFINELLRQCELDQSPFVLLQNQESAQHNSRWQSGYKAKPDHFVRLRNGDVFLVVEDKAKNNALPQLVAQAISVSNDSNETIWCMLVSTHMIIFYKLVVPDHVRECVSNNKKAYVNEEFSIFRYGSIGRRGNWVGPLDFLDSVHRATILQCLLRIKKLQLIKLQPSPSEFTIPDGKGHTPPPDHEPVTPVITRNNRKKRYRSASTASPSYHLVEKKHARNEDTSPGLS
jgi:hypothetical protein